MVRSCLDGYSACIFAYGQTGSGKTFTMDGPEALPGEHSLRCLNAPQFCLNRKRAACKWPGCCFTTAHQMHRESFRTAAERMLCRRH